VFPTTVWTDIGRAGAQDPGALAEFAARYRGPVLEYVSRRGFGAADAEDVCQDVFVRVIAGGVLSKADRNRGRFRSLLLAVTTHVIQDRLRRRGELAAGDLLDPPCQEPDFDRPWALHLAERAMQRLGDEGSPYYEVLRRHLGGEKQDRNRLWIARRRLGELIRAEVAHTCATREDFDQEMSYLSAYLRPVP
jgi:hypothetical protein